MSSEAKMPDEVWINTADLKLPYSGRYYLTIKQAGGGGVKYTRAASVPSDKERAEALAFTESNINTAKNLLTLFEDGVSSYRKEQIEGSIECYETIKRALTAPDLSALEAERGDECTRHIYGNMAKYPRKCMNCGSDERDEVAGQLDEILTAAHAQLNPPPPPQESVDLEELKAEVWKLNCEKYHNVQGDIRATTIVEVIDHLAATHNISKKGG